MIINNDNIIQFRVSPLLTAYKINLFLILLLLLPLEMKHLLGLNRVCLFFFHSSQRVGLFRGFIITLTDLSVKS